MPGIRDRVAVAGVGATRFTEHWEKDQEDLLVEAVDEACIDAGIERSDIQAIWAGVYYHTTGMGGAAAVDPLRLYGIPATRVENFCASGMDAFRNACFAVAAGVWEHPRRRARPTWQGRFSRNHRPPGAALPDRRP